MRWVAAGVRLRQNFYFTRDRAMKSALRPAYLYQQQHGDVGDSGVVGAHALGSFGLNPYLRRLDAQQGGDVLLNGGGVRSDLWSGENESAIDVADLVAGLVDQLQRLLDEDGRICAFPLGIAGREIGSDVAGGNGAEQRVGDGMQQDVTIRMTGKSSVMRDGETADFERDAVFELVGVPTVADAGNAG